MENSPLFVTPSFRVDSKSPPCTMAWSVPRLRGLLVTSPQPRLPFQDAPWARSRLDVVSLSLCLVVQVLVLASCKPHSSSESTAVDPNPQEAPDSGPSLACGGATDWASANSSARDARESTKALEKALDLHPGQIVWDIGAGGGYWTRKMTYAVGGDGTVVATDSDASCLDILAQRGPQWGPARLLLQKVSFWVPPPLDPKAHRTLLANSLVFRSWDSPGWALFGAIAEGLAARILFEGTRPGGRVIFYLDFDPPGCIPASKVAALFKGAGFLLDSEQDPRILDTPAASPDSPEQRCRSFAVFSKPLS